MLHMDGGDKYKLFKGVSTLGKIVLYRAQAQALRPPLRSPPLVRFRISDLILCQSSRACIHSPIQQVGVCTSVVCNPLIHKTKKVGFYYYLITVPPTTSIQEWLFLLQETVPGHTWPIPESTFSSMLNCSRGPHTCVHTYQRKWSLGSSVLESVPRPLLWEKKAKKKSFLWFFFCKGANIDDLYFCFLASPVYVSVK